MLQCTENSRLSISPSAPRMEWCGITLRRSAPYFVPTPSRLLCVSKLVCVVRRGVRLDWKGALRYQAVASEHNLLSTPLVFALELCFNSMFTCRRCNAFSCLVFSLVTLPPFGAKLETSVSKEEQLRACPDPAEALLYRRD